MAGSKFFLLLDDIASLLDDVSVLTKVAAKKTAGVVSDDLAVNANQVSGVSADRELPVVWAVAKGSLWNKVILIPLVLLLAFVSTVLLSILLVIGGLYLCYEGAEKVLSLVHKHPEDHNALVAALEDTKVDILAFEKEKIKGAIRTDFVLSAEIIVIAMGVLATAPFTTQLVSLCIIGLAMTVGVYGLVALIVKLDDIGLYMVQTTKRGGLTPLRQLMGRAILNAAPLLMRSLSVFGTIAMFLVGGNILVHQIPLLHHFSEAVTHLTHAIPVLGTLSGLTTAVFEMMCGLVAGLLVVALMLIVNRLKPLFIKS